MTHRMAAGQPTMQVQYPRACLKGGQEGEREGLYSATKTGSTLWHILIELYGGRCDRSISAGARQMRWGTECRLPQALCRAYPCSSVINWQRRIAGIARYHFGVQLHGTYKVAGYQHLAEKHPDKEHRKRSREWSCNNRVVRGTR